MIKVSTVSIDITPRIPVKLCGYVNEVRNSKYATKAHKPIYAVVLSMLIGSKRLLFISLDVLSITKEYANQIKIAISKKYAIDVEQIHVNAIHTHSGPSGFSVDAMGKEYESNVDYRKYVIENIVSGMSSVFGYEIEVHCYIGKTNINGFYDNRNSSDLFFDNEAYILNFIDKNENIVASLINLNVHSTVLGPMNMEISYDLIGTVREKISEHYKVFPYMCIGTSADISNRHFRKGDGFDELDRTAEGISYQLSHTTSFDKIDIKDIDIRTFTYLLQYDNQENYREFRNKLNGIDKELLIEKDKTKIKLLLSSRDKLETKLKIKLVKKEIVSTIIRLGELTIITFPGELTSIFGKYLKEKSKTKYTFVITCCDDHHGYFIEAGLFGKCYESTATLIPKFETEHIIEELGEYL